MLAPRLGPRRAPCVPGSISCPAMAAADPAGAGRSCSPAAINRRDLDAAVAMWTEDAAIVAADGSLVRGREAIVEALGALAQQRHRVRGRGGRHLRGRRHRTRDRDAHAERRRSTTGPTSTAATRPSSTRAARTARGASRSTHRGACRPGGTRERPRACRPDGRARSRGGRRVPGPGRTTPAIGKLMRPSSIRGIVSLQRPAGELAAASCVKRHPEVVRLLGVGDRQRRARALPFSSTAAADLAVPGGVEHGVHALRVRPRGAARAGRPRRRPVSPRARSPARACLGPRCRPPARRVRPPAGSRSSRRRPRRRGRAASRPVPSFSASSVA